MCNCLQHLIQWFKRLHIRWWKVDKQLGILLLEFLPLIIYVLRWNKKIGPIILTASKTPTQSHQYVSVKKDLPATLTRFLTSYFCLNCSLIIHWFLSLLPPCRVWQYGLWSFQTGCTKLERFLPKNQHTQRKLLNFENRTNGEVSKIEHHFSNKVI